MRQLIIVLAVLCLSSAVYGACKDSWHKFGNSCYGFSTEIMSWGDAQAMCHAYGGGLAVIETDAENTFLKTVAQGKGHEIFWVGATDVFHHGTWTWIGSGALMQLGYSDWYTNQPLGINYGCMVLRKAYGYKWESLYCPSHYYFICETADVVLQ